jgi:hypothetical protein
LGVSRAELHYLALYMSANLMHLLPQKRHLGEMHEYYSLLIKRPEEEWQR